MFAAGFLVFICILSAASSLSGFNVLKPRTLNATGGSCLVIPCQFSVSSETEALIDKSSVGTVQWKRGALWKVYGTVNFTDAHRKMEPVVEVVGDLRMKNCTSVMKNLTSLHSDRYFINIKYKDQILSDSTPLRINVSDSLPEPNVTVPLLREGEMANLTCSLPVPCPSQTPNITWAPALGGIITQWIQLNADGTRNVSANLSFVPSSQHHNLNVSCVSIHPRDDKPLKRHKPVPLNVEYPPKETHVSLSGWVWLGNNLTLTCVSNANPPAVAHRWLVKKDGVEEDLGAADVLTFIAAQNNSGEYMCEAQNIWGAMNSTKLQINVPGISFSTVLSVILSVILLLIFAVFILIYRWCKQSHRMETTQDDIYANVSPSGVKIHQFESRIRPDDNNYTLNPECTASDPDESIYANY